MSRQVILDTETTGLSARMGDRIIEIGCVEMQSRRLSGNNWHRYINPERKSEEGALAVHGIADDFLLDKPKFRDIAREFLDYIRGAEIIIHNAAFDVDFLDAELELAGLGKFSTYCLAVIDTLKMAKSLHPGKRNSLDALCERYQIDNSHRTLHGALLDAELLAEVYVSMTRGQDSLAIEVEADQPGSAAMAAWLDRPRLPVLAPTADELAAHESTLAKIETESKGKCLWLKLGATTGSG